MTPFEVEEAYRYYFVQESSAISRISQFHGHISPNTIGPKTWAAWLSLTVIPMYPVRDLFVPLCFLNQAEFQSMIIGPHSRLLLEGIDRFTPNVKGLNSSYRSDEGLLLWDHAIYRDGAISLGINIPNHHSIANIAPSFAIIRFLYDCFSFLAGVFVRAGYSSSLLVDCSIQFNQSYDLGVSNQLREAYWDRQLQNGPPIHFVHTLTISPDQWTDSPSATLEMLLHHLWQSFGYMRCDYYNGNTGQFLHDRIDITQVLR